MLEDAGGLTNRAQARVALGARGSVGALRLSAVHLLKVGKPERRCGLLRCLFWSGLVIVIVLMMAATF